MASAPLYAMMTCAGSCAGACATSAICKLCSCSCVLPQKLTSVFYFAILMVFGLTACIGRFDGGDIFLGFGYNATEASMIGKITHASSSSIFDYWNNRFTCAKARPGDIIICCANECSGVWWVYRCSFVLCLFFASLLCAPRFFFPSAMAEEEDPVLKGLEGKVS